MDICDSYSLDSDHQFINCLISILSIYYKIDMLDEITSC